MDLYKLIAHRAKLIAKSKSELGQEVNHLMSLSRRFSKGEVAMFVLRMPLSVILKLEIYNFKSAKLFVYHLGNFLHSSR